MDWGAQIVDQVNALVTAQGTVLVPLGLKLLAYICVFRLLVMVSHMLLRGALDGAGGWHTSIHFSEVLILLFQVALITLVLNNYFTLSDLPRVFAKDIVATFDRAAIDNFLGYVSGVVSKTPQPNPLQILDIAIYLIILAEMGVLSAAMFVITSFGVVGYGVYVVLGPLFIPLAMTRRFSGWFWNWMQALFAFAAYRVMAAAIGWVYANVFVYFFVHGIGTNYAIANWLALLPVVFMLSIAFVYSMFKIPSLTAQLFSGAGGIGQQYVSAVGGAIRAAAAAL